MPCMTAMYDNIGRPVEKAPYDADHQAVVLFGNCCEFGKARAGHSLILSRAFTLALSRSFHNGTILTSPPPESFILK